MKPWYEWSKKELLKLPKRNWCTKSKYPSVLLVNSKYKHESGFNLFAVVGVDNNGIPYEIAGYMDDFRLDSINVFTKVELDPYNIAFDCSMHGVFRLHSMNYNIIVGANTSTTCFAFEEVENPDLEEYKEKMKDYEDEEKNTKKSAN